VPTLKESGIPFSAYAWLGVCAGAGIPQPVVDLLNSRIVQVVNSADYRALVEKSGSVAVSSSAPEFRALIEETANDAAPIFREFGVQDWPTRPVTMVVPFAAGGAFDVVGRVFAPHLSHSLGQQVIVENVGAAAGIVGTNRVAKAPPDGYVFLYGTVGTHAYNPALYKKLPYNAATEFAPVLLFAEQPMVLVTRKDFPADSLQEFIAHVKANAAKLQYAPARGGPPPP